MARQGSCDLFEAVPVGIGFDDREGIGLSGVPSKRLKIFEKTVRLKFYPGAVLDPGCILNYVNHAFFFPLTFLPVPNDANKPAKILWAGLIF